MPNDLIPLRHDLTSLRDVFSCTVECGIVFHKQPTPEQAAKLLECATLARVHSSRIIGQILCKIDDLEHRHGEKYTQAMHYTGLSHDTLRQYASVVRSLGERWNYRLGMSYHSAVSGLSPSLQKHYLDLCDPGVDDMPPSMSRDELRALIRQEVSPSTITHSATSDDIPATEPIPEDVEFVEDRTADDERTVNEDLVRKYEQPPERVKSVKPGQIKFDPKPVESAISKLVAALQVTLKANPADKQHWENCKSSLNEFVADWKAWRRAKT